MRRLKILFILFFCSSLSFIPQFGFTDEKENEELEKIIEDFEKKHGSGADTQDSIRKIDTYNRTQVQSNDKVRVSRPVYKPPRRGAPVGRIAGGTRGILDEYPSDLCVITPDHTSTTVSDQPIFYWYLRKLTTYPIEFTLIEEQAISPILEIHIPSPSKAGLQSLPLSDYGVHIERDKVYKWYLAIVPDYERRSKDILAWSAVKYIAITDQLKKRLSKFDKVTKVKIFAAAGIWYDAFDDLSRLIENSPNNKELITMRDSLLDQIGLIYIVRDEANILDNNNKLRAW